MPFFGFLPNALTAACASAACPLLFVLILVSSPSLVGRAATSSTRRRYIRNSEHGEKCHRKIGERLPVGNLTTVKLAFKERHDIIRDITGEGLSSTINGDLGTAGLPLRVVLGKG